MIKYYVLSDPVEKGGEICKALVELMFELNLECCYCLYSKNVFRSIARRILGGGGILMPAAKTNLVYDKCVFVIQLNQNHFRGVNTFGSHVLSYRCSELFEVNHIRTIYHMFIALLILFILSTLVVDFIDEGR